MNVDNTAYGIIGTGSYLPPVVVSNEQVAARAGVTAEWIARKTGITERRHALPQQAASDLAAEAGRAALADAGIRAEQLGCVVVATSTPDHPQPATANLVQDLLGADAAAAFDLNAVCSGFVYAAEVARSMLAAGPGAPYALVIGVDVYSRILDHEDRRTAVLFGDGAGAVVLGPAPAGTGLAPALLRGHGDRNALIRVPAGGSRMPASARTLAGGEHFFKMDGRGVREFVHEYLPKLIADALAGARLRPEQIDHFVPHQANGAMLADVLPATGLRPDSVRMTVGRYGNTGAASIPITLDAAHRDGLIRPGDRVLMAGFGGGMNVGALLCTWHARAAHAAAETADEALVLAGR
jgi:3-oxoacyl-[acyl-carrier-protein] synthase-3